MIQYNKKKVPTDPRTIQYKLTNQTKLKSILYGFDLAKNAGQLLYGPVLVLK